MTSGKDNTVVIDSPVVETGEASAAPVSTTGEYPPSEIEKTHITAKDYIPEFQGKPWTAPVYKAQNQNIQTMPFPVGCIKSASKCTCYTEQATPIRDLDDGLCRDFADNGIYNPYLAKGQSLPPVTDNTVIASVTKG